MSLYFFSPVSYFTSSFATEVLEMFVCFLPASSSNILLINIIPKNLEVFFIDYWKWQGVSCGAAESVGAIV